MIELRPYQQESIQSLRDGISSGHRKQILCAPTGAGKTVCGAYLLQEVFNKGRKAAFVVDRVSLVEQTSRTLWDFGIEHGIAQGKNTRGRQENIQVCSAQTIEKRGFWPDIDLLIIDEAHTMRRQVLEFVNNVRVPVIGLTATPFSKGLGEVYSRVTNVTTTNRLIEQGFLAPLKVYAAKEIDMTGAKVIAGEWSDNEITERGKAIVGDVVKEWEDKTTKHFGGPVKTIAFSATVDHGEEMCRQFQAAGYDFRQISYKDKDDDHRAKLIEEFRRGRITGLVSCEALAKGFDVPDIQCLICARPYRKSFSSHIQMIGRAMRSAPGKEYALLLDHAGNFLGFYDQMIDFFENGVDSLNEEGRDNKVRDEKVKERRDIVCSCGFVLAAHMDRCPSCGKERVRKNRVEIVAGEMVEIGAKAEQKEFLRNKETVWYGLITIATNYKGYDDEACKRFALAQYRNIYKEWPARSWPFLRGHADSKLVGLVKRNLIAYFKAKAAA